MVDGAGANLYQDLLPRGLGRRDLFINQPIRPAMLPKSHRPHHLPLFWVRPLGLADAFCKAETKALRRRGTAIRCLTWAQQSGMQCLYLTPTRR